MNWKRSSLSADLVLPPPHHERRKWQGIAIIKLNFQGLLHPAVVQARQPDMHPHRNLSNLLSADLAAQQSEQQELGKHLVSIKCYIHSCSAHNHTPK